MDGEQPPLTEPQPKYCQRCRDGVAHTITECRVNEVRSRGAKVTGVLRGEQRPSRTLAADVLEHLSRLVTMYRESRLDERLYVNNGANMWDELVILPWHMSRPLAYRAPFVARLYQLMRDLLIELARGNSALILDAAMSPNEETNPYMLLIAIGVAGAVGDLPCSPTGETANQVFNRRLGGRLFPITKRRCPKSTEVWSTCMRLNHTSLFLFNLVNETPFAEGETIDRLYNISTEEAGRNYLGNSRPILPEMYRYLQRDGRCVFCTFDHPLGAGEVCQYESLCKLIFVGDVPGVVAMLNANPRLSLQTAVSGDPLWLAVREGQEAIYPDLDIEPRAVFEHNTRDWPILREYPVFSLSPAHFAPDVPMLVALMGTRHINLAEERHRTQVMQDVAFASGRVSEMLGLYDLVMRMDPAMFQKGLQHADLNEQQVEMVVSVLEQIVARINARQAGTIRAAETEREREGRLGFPVLLLMLKSARDMLRPVWSTSPRFSTTHHARDVAKARLLVWLFAKLREDGKAAPPDEIIPMICMYLDPTIRQSHPYTPTHTRLAERQHPLSKPLFFG